MRLLWLRQIRVSRLARVVCSLLFLYLASPAWPFDFVDNGNGTITDTATGLQWMRCTMGEQWTGSGCSGSATYYTWAAANALSSTVTFAGASDWRLPTIDELKTLIDSSHLPAIDSTAFPGGLYSARYWSSTVHASYQDYAWYVMFDVGNATANAQAISINVRMVRSGSTTTTDTQPPGTNTTNERLNISASELAGMITVPVIYGTPPTAFRDTDPLGVTGVALLDAQARLMGDTLRVDNIVIDNVSYWIDFRYDSASGQFQPGTLTAGAAPALSRSDLPGIGTTTPPAVATLGGPPLAADIWPIVVQGTPLGVGLLFSPSSLSFSIRDARVLNSGFVAALSGGSFASDPIDSYIAAQGQVDTHLKSGADWNAAALSCASKLVGALNLGSVGTNALQMMASDGPEVFQGMREALLMGNPQDATLIFSQLAWKALAQNATSDSELAAVFNKIAEKAGYAQALSQGAGACTVDYKQGLQSLLQGAVSTAFPISSCVAELAYEGVKEARTALNDNILQQLYAQWKALGQDGDDVFDYPMVRGDTGLFGTLVRQKYGSEYDTYLQNPERYFDLVAADLKARFRQWQAAETAGNTTRTRLQDLKSRFDALGGYKSDIRALLPEGADDTQVFKRYVELMQRFRARLAPFMPSTVNATTLDGYAESLLYAYLDPSAGKSRQAAWQEALASRLRDWQPDLFTTEPEVCAIGSGGDVQLGSMTLIYDYVRDDRQLTSVSYCYGSSSATKGSYYFTRESGSGGSNQGTISGSGSNFTASCSNCLLPVSCQGSVSGDTSSATLSMTCTQGTTTLTISGATSAGLALVSGTGSGTTYDQTQGKYVTCDGLNVSGTVSGSFGVGSAAP